MHVPPATVHSCVLVRMYVHMIILTFVREAKVNFILGQSEPEQKEQDSFDPEPRLVVLMTFGIPDP